MSPDRAPSHRRYRRFWGADPRRDAEEELAFHLAMRADEFRRAGMSEAQAQEATMHRFGNIAEIRTEVDEIAQKRHARRRRAWQLDAFRQDVRVALRTLLANPGYTIVVALTLALGIGANAAVFSVAYGVLLRPLPYRDADRLVRVWSSNEKRGLDKFSVSPADFADWLTQARSFSAMAAFERQHEATLATRDAPQSVPITAVTPEVFPLLGALPAMGRTLVADDARPESPRAAVISDALWATRFGGDTGIVGRGVNVDGKRYTIVGVMPRRFVIPGTNADLWTALSLSGLPVGHSYRYLRVLGRLAPGVSADAAHAELDILAARTSRAFPADAAGWATSIQSVPEMIIGAQFRRAVLTLVGVVVFVLLIACANAANLQLARGASRDRELAVRVALGATRSRIALQLLTESVMVSVVAGAVGLALAFGGVALLRAVGTTTVPRLEDVRLDAPVCVFATCVALGSGILFGLIPAFRGSRANVGDVLRQAGRGAGQSRIASGVRGALVIAEISLSLVLLIGAGLLMRSVVRLQAVDLGFSGRNVFVASQPPSAFPTPQSATAFYMVALERATSLAGVESAAAVSSAPFSGPNVGGLFLPADQAPSVNAQAPDADFRVISSGYFRTMGIRLLRGRDVSPEDREGSPEVVLVNATLANKSWPNQTPVGRQIRVNDLEKGPLLTIVGVVADARYYDVEAEAPRPTIYFSMYFSWYGTPQPAMQLVVRGRNATVAGSLRALLASLDPRVPAPAVTSLEDSIASATASQRFALTLFGIFAAIAAALAAIGLYGVLSYLVRQRTHELGIRAALGTPRLRLVSLVIGGAIRLTAVGVVVGLAGAYALTRSLGSLLFGVSPTDVTTFIALPLVLTAIACMASLVPALRATRADPMLALRGED